MLPASRVSAGSARGTAYRLLLLVAAMAVLTFGLTPPAQAAATITLSSTSGQAGSSVTVTGAGFPKRTKGTVVAGTANVAVTTTSTGTFPASIVMPTVPGTVTVTATAGSAVASAPFTVVDPVPMPSGTRNIRFGVGTNGGA